MTSFHVRHSEQMLYENNIRSRTARLSEHIRSCERTIGILVGETTFTGRFADAVKRYFGEVHLGLLESAGQILRELENRTLEYINGYQTIEEKEGFVLKSDAMYGFTESAARCRQKLEGYDAVIREHLKQAADILTLPAVSVGRIQEVTGRLTGEVRYFSERIEHYEEQTKGLIQETDRLLRLFESCLDRIRQTELSDLSKGSAGALRSICGLQELQDALALKYLAGLSLTDSMVGNLKELGYTVSDIVNLFDNCQNETDHGFLRLLAATDYREAFQTAPVNLSEEMDLVLADYLYRLFTGGDLSRFTLCCNAILAQTDLYITQECTADRMEQYRDIYLQRLFAGTSVLLDMNSCFILSGNADDEEKKKNWELLKLASFWGSQAEILQELHSLFPCHISITDQNFVLQDICYDFMYFIPAGPGRKKSAILQAEMKILETSDDLFTAEYLTGREELVHRTENLWKEVLADGVEGAFAGVLAVLFPELSAGYGILKAMFTAPNDLDRHLLKQTERNPGTAEKAGKAVLEELVDGVQSYFTKKAELEKALAEKDRMYTGHFWGSAGQVSYDGGTFCMTGLYNPAYLETIAAWNREGIGGLDPALDQQKIFETAQSGRITRDSLAYKMIYGFGGESILDYPINEIAEAKTEVEQLIRMSDEGYRNWNVEDAF